VAVVEPRLDMLVCCLSQTDYSQMLENQKLFFIPPDKLTMRRLIFRQLGLQLEFGDIYLQTDAPSRQLGVEYDAWNQRCQEVLADFRIELNTLRAFQDVMVRNELDNFHRAMAAGSISTFQDSAKGAFAVMIGGGPSLNNFAPMLTDQTGNAVYASAFQTIPSLQQCGMKPHFCMAIDPTKRLKETYDHLDKKWAEDVPLIYSCKVSPDLVSAYPGPSMPIWTMGGLGAHLWKDREPVFDSGRNVGIALMRFLKWCGIRDILFVGFDFGWSGDTTHARGHLVSKNKFSFDPQKHIQLKNKKGEDIYSSRQLITALRSLETEISAGDINVYNLYGNHATIEGAREVTLGEVLSSGLLKSASGSVQRFHEKLNESRDPRPLPVFEARSAAWATSLKAAQKRLESHFKNTAQNQKEIHSALNHLLFFLNQDPLYQPYLLTDIRNLSGMIFNKDPYNGQDLSRCKKIVKRALDKVREMDEKLAAQPAPAQVV
jgi:hypothetical protein